MLHHKSIIVFCSGAFITFLLCGVSYWVREWIELRENQKNNRIAARVMDDFIVSWLYAYRLDSGEFPASVSWRDQLREFQSKRYRSTNDSLVNRLIASDPWGNPYYYELRTSDGDGDDFWLLSKGRNGLLEYGGDDIIWTRETSGLIPEIFESPEHSRLKLKEPYSDDNEQ